jgi:hypothetical protein
LPSRHAPAQRAKPDKRKFESYPPARKREEGHRMASLRHIHQFMNERRLVRLADGRTGKIIRVDTLFPDNDTQVTVWTPDMSGPDVAKIERFELKDVVGAAS